MMNATKAKILAVDDSIPTLDIISSTLSKCGYDVEVFESLKKAFLRLSRDNFDLALVDLVMPGIDGFKIISHIKNDLPFTEVVVITGEPDNGKIDACKELGVHNFLIKPFSAPQLEYTVYAALYAKRIREDFQQRTLDNERGFRIVGISRWAQSIRDEIRIAARSDLPVLITGETGTGKELIAKDIHYHSQRKNRPFLAINCATMGTLMESELFGHASGSFTGANRSTRGYIGAAQGGTLFLDEIGDMPIALQAKLLRFLDSGEYLRVGESKVRRADVRIISATNTDLSRLCENDEFSGERVKSKFRRDLYFRIAGCHIQTLPLREHPEDIPILGWHFIQQISESKGRPFEITADALAALKEYPWPGNVRQLRHTIALLCERSNNNIIELSQVLSLLQLSRIKKLKYYQLAKREALEEFDKKYFSEVLLYSRGSLKKALAVTGMHKKNFYTKLKAIGISSKSFAKTPPSKTSVHSLAGYQGWDERPSFESCSHQ